MSNGTRARRLKSNLFFMSSIMYDNEQSTWEIGKHVTSKQNAYQATLVHVGNVHRGNQYAT